MTFGISGDRITYSAIIRNDRIMTVGKSHSEIMQRSPMGTCKKGSTQGFVTNEGTFVDRCVAYQIALKAGQIKTEKMHPKDRDYLLSEDIWSEVSNGDYEYNVELGYVLKTENSSN